MKSLPFEGEETRMKAQTNLRPSIMTAAVLCAVATPGWAGDHGIAGWAGNHGNGGWPGAHDVVVLSSRADMVSGGDALVELDAPFGIKRAHQAGGNAKIHADLNGDPVPEGTFTVRPDGRLYGLVSGLRIGKNVLTVRFPGKTIRTT